MAAMTTHRSLNKLEYKAHMSIHNVAEVESPESHESAFTRDRLGRRHRLFEEDGTPRIFKTATVFVAIFLGMTSIAFAVPQNMSVTSDELEQKNFNDRLGSHKANEKFAFFDDGSNSVGINENGDPSLAMRF